MSVVSSAQVVSSSYSSPTLAVGDIVALVVASGIEGASISTPSGWERVPGNFDVWIGSGGGLTGSGWLRVGVFWRRATGTSLSASFGRTRTIVSTVVRGPSALADAGVLTNNAQAFQFPGLSFGSPMTGDVLHVGLVGDGISDISPSGDTAAQHTYVSISGFRNLSGGAAFRTGTVDVSTRALSSATSTPAASNPARLYGKGVTLAFANVAGPDAPAVTSPAAGSNDLAAGFTIAWTPTWEQTGYAIRRRSPASSGSWQWWNGSNWSASSETVISSSATSLAVAAGVFSNAATTYDIAVATRGDALRPELGPYAQVSVVGKAAPGAPTLAASSTSGTVPTNLATNGGVETDLTGWGRGFGAGSNARDTTRARSGVASVKSTGVAGESSTALLSVSGLTVGAAYTLTVWGFAPAGSPDVYATAYFRKDSARVTVKDAWVPMTVTFTAQSSTEGVGVGQVTGHNPTGPQTVWVDDVFLSAGTGPQFKTLTSFTPTLTMTGGAGSGGTFTGYRVQILQGGETLHDAVVSSPFVVPTSVGLLMDNDGPLLTVRAAIVQDTTMQGPWTTEAFTVAVPRPAAPTILASQTEHPVSGLPGARVAVTSAIAGNVSLSRDGVVIATALAAPGVPLIFDDYSVTANSTYTATVSTLDAIPVTSLPAMAHVGLEDSHCWLFDPYHPETAVRAHVTTDGARGWDLRAAAQWLLGTSRAAVPAGVATDASGQRTVETMSRVDADKVHALLASGRTLRHRGWVELGLSRHPDSPARDLVFAPVGSVSEAAESAPHAWFQTTFDWAEVQP